MNFNGQQVLQKRRMLRRLRNSDFGRGFLCFSAQKSRPKAAFSCNSISSSFMPRRRAADSTVVRQGEVDKGRYELEME
jgi:hypothetical protein